MRKSVGVVYHYWASYRLPVLLEFMRSSSPSFTIYSGYETRPSSIRGVDPKLATVTVRAGGLRWHKLHNFWFGPVFLWQFGLLRILLSDRHDAFIFLGSMYHLSTWLALVICRFRKIPCYLWTHGVTTNKNSLKERVRRLFYRQASGLFLYGHYAKKCLIEAGFDESKLTVIYNSLDFASQQSELEKLIAVGNEPNVLGRFNNPDLPLISYVGRLSGRKKLDLLVKALGILESEGYSANVAMIGNGETISELKLLAKSELRLSEVVFFGALYSEEDLAPIMSSTSLCVSPGHVGLSAIHAMGYGIPVVTHDNPANQAPEFEAIIDGVTGSLFKENSVNDLATKIKYWLEKSQNLQETRESCIDMVKSRYNPKIQVSIMAQAINATSENKQSR